MSKKWGIDFQGVDRYMEQLKKVEGAAQKAVDKALIETQKLVADRAEKAMEPHNKTGETAEQILRDGYVIWTGDAAEIGVGFMIAADGELPGLPSIFLMYGTVVHGQPSVSPDQSLYDAVYGSEVRREARKIQKQIFLDAVQEVMK